MSLSLKSFNLVEMARNLPPTFLDDIIDMLGYNYATGDADLKLLSAFLQAAEAIVASPRYLIMKGKRAAASPEHCVRCHATFSEDDNHDTACVIPHVFDKARPEVWYGRVYAYSSRCCGPFITLNINGKGIPTNADRLGTCYEGMHTADVGDLEFDGTDAKINIYECKTRDGQCVRGCVGVGVQDPVFVHQFDRR